MAAIGRVLLIPKGDYSGSTAYNALDWVRDNGAAWVCKLDNTIGVAPPTLPTTSNANWQLLSADGTVSGSVDWSNVNNKPFNSVGNGLNVNASNEIELDTAYLTASNISYDNSGSGATAVDVQAAIDELFAGGGGGGLSNAFDEVDVGGVKLDANGGDTLYLLAGSNITLTPNAATNEITIESTGGGTGGHTMKPDPTSNPTEADVVTWVKGASSTNDQVPSLYGVQNWSNAEITTLIAHIAQNSDTVGVWNDTWETDGIKTGWVWHECLYHTIPDNEVEISIDFDIGGKEVVVLYAYRVDDEVYNAVTSPSGNPQAQGWYELSGSTYVLTTDTSVVGGKTYYKSGGAIAIKLTSAIQNASGVDVAINLKRQRTNLVTNPTILS